jgi:hypothetical protein
LNKLTLKNVKIPYDRVGEVKDWNTEQNLSTDDKVLKEDQEGAEKVILRPV